MDKYRHNTNGSTKLVLVKQNFLLRGIRDSRTLIVQVLIGAMHGTCGEYSCYPKFRLNRVRISETALYAHVLASSCLSKQKKIFGGLNTFSYY